MKKSIIKILSLAFVAAVFMTSCDPETEDEKTEVIQKLENGEMNGELTESYTLDPTETYELTGSFIVPEGMSLTIHAGTNIVAEAGGTEVD